MSVVYSNIVIIIGSIICCLSSYSRLPSVFIFRSRDDLLPLPHIVVMHPQVSLKTYRTKAGLVKAVTKIEPLSTGTMTGLAIQFALNVAFSESEGARVKSPDIIKVQTHK